MSDQKYYFYNIILKENIIIIIIQAVFSINTVYEPTQNNYMDFIIKIGIYDETLKMILNYIEIWHFLCFYGSI